VVFPRPRKGESIVQAISNPPPQGRVMRGKEVLQKQREEKDLGGRKDLSGGGRGGRGTGAL